MMDLETMKIIGMISFIVGLIIVFGNMYLDSKRD